MDGRQGVGRRTRGVPNSWNKLLTCTRTLYPPPSHTPKLTPGSCTCCTRCKTYPDLTPRWTMFSVDPPSVAQTSRVLICPDRSPYYCCTHHISCMRPTIQGGRGSLGPIALAVTDTSARTRGERQEQWMGTVGGAIVASRTCSCAYSQLQVQMYTAGPIANIVWPL